MFSKTPFFLALLPLAFSSPLSLKALQAASEPTPRRAAAAAACSDMTLIFARGTTEAAPIGSVAGPPLVSAIQKSIGSATLDVQGVDYPADIPGFLAGGDAGGSKNMADMVSTAMTTCPNTKIIMSGYSQGGQLVHNAAAMLPASTMSAVSSVVIFGDPDNGKPVAGASAANVKVICHDGDNICAGGDLILAPHLTYGSDAGTAASFVTANAAL